ncbi:glycoside hydrolase family 3 protein [Paenibacillus sp. FA6]|uniref:glycoside hydrolase family 3 protein n=1 Tax=Paenibacillus sp. FA6 TaxID=3413029 RepID=UPI003F65B0BA
MERTTMSLEEKVAQLFTVSAGGTVLDDTIRKLIAEWKIGGVFLGTTCLHQPEQVHALTVEMQQVSMKEGSGQPLFISADFIAGVGCKLKDGAVHFPKNRAIGETQDEALAYEAGRITAMESLAMGVNFNYSPVVDINNNPLNPVIGTHSFGEDPDLVSRLGSAIIRGYQDHGLIATAKHFPGHGDTHVDSHEDLPLLSFDAERMDSFELIPFKRAIADGVDSVMVGHIAVPSLDETLTPASLSYPITTGLLRHKLGFDGVIVTDGLSMKGITNQFTQAEACVKALQAGADILLAFPNSYEDAVSMLEAVILAVKDGTISESRIDESLERLNRVRQKYHLTSDTFEQKPYDSSLFLTEEAVKVDDALAMKALTPLQGIQAGCLTEQLHNLTSEQACILICYEQCTSFVQLLLAKAPELKLVSVKDVDQTVQAISETGEADLIIVATAGSKPLGKDKSALINERIKSRKQSVWVHFGSPYDMDDVQAPSLLVYDFAPSLQKAAASYLLKGKSRI